MKQLFLSPIRQEKNKTTLLIEEQKTLIEKIKKKFESQGLDVWTAKSIDQALSYLDLELDKSKEINVILLEKSKTVLVIEDELPLLKVIKKKLELEGFSVITARSVNEGLSYLLEWKKVDLIWLDHYLLGKEDGQDFVFQLKNGDDGWRKIPIFVVSNYTNPERCQSYLDMGIDKYYTKTENHLSKIINEMHNFLPG